MALVEDIGSKSTTHCVVGLGYVGLPLAILFSQAGFKVVGFDVDQRKVDALKEGQTEIDDVSQDALQKEIASGRLTFTTDSAELNKVDSFSICVPTPLSKAKEPDLSFVRKATTLVFENIKSGSLVVLESTTYPGTTRELLGEAAEEAGLCPGKDIFIAFSPERVDPGNTTWHTKNTPKVLGGLTPACTEMAAALYGQAVDQVVVVKTTEEAEMVKLLENTFRMVNIGLVNELTIMCDRMGIDIWDVINAAATKPFGFMPFYPGPGIGGHCIPLDPLYLTFKAKNFNFFNRLIEASTDINGNMPRFTVEKAVRILNDAGKAMKGSRIHLLGVAYKANISDARESPAEEVIKQLLARHAEVSYEDPNVNAFRGTWGELRHEEKRGESLASVDLVIMLTAHKDFPLDTFAESGVPVLDTRNAFRAFDLPTIHRL